MSEQLERQQRIEKWRKHFAGLSDAELLAIISVKPQNEGEALVLELARWEIQQRERRGRAWEEGAKAAWDQAWSQGYQGCLAVASLLLIFSCFVFDDLSTRISRWSFSTRVVVIMTISLAGGLAIVFALLRRRRVEISDRHSSEGMTILFPPAAGKSQDKNNENTNS